MKKRLVALSVCLASVGAFADIAKVRVVVIDEKTQAPVEGATVKAWFQWNIGWKAWSEPTPIVTDTKITDGKGFCRLEGKTNVGEVGIAAQMIPGKYYSGSGNGFEFKRKDVFGVWQPDNLVATIRLQRVEHPIPLFVKRVELRDGRNGIGGFDGTNSVLRFDLMKGEWLPPYGNGEVSDIEIGSSVKITGTGKYRKAYPEFGWTSMNFYELVSRISVSDADRIMTFVGEPNAGLKIRIAHEDLLGCSVTRSRGERQVFEKNGKDWHTENFNDRDPNRCYTFRIRSRRNDEGKLVEAYYGKIYGDFEFEGDDKKGLIGVKFLYYLNPTSLDRNLEWDMKNNLCPNGNVGLRQP